MPGRLARPVPFSLELGAASGLDKTSLDVHSNA
jgi:hypothetical protein